MIILTGRILIKDQNKLKMLIGHGAPFQDIWFINNGGKGWLGLLPYICIGIILISNQKKENQESAWILSNDLFRAIKSCINR